MGVVVGMDIACLRPSDFTDSDGANYTHILEDITDEYGLDVSFADYRPDKGELPSAEDVYDAVVVTGSKSHVYDEEDREWVEPLEQYLEQALSDGTPVLGICYGHQVLADTLNGDVDRMPEREMGYRDVMLTDAGEDHPLFNGVPGEFTTFTSHQDHVSRLPQDAIELAQNEYGNHAYAVEYEDVVAYGIQFHPEYSIDMAMKLVEEKELPEDDEEAVRSTFTPENVDATETARDVIANFFRQLD